ncbi:hypothetical protein DFQ27_000983 [Actinomortierella ambigua]|uniref:Uncharacterized protein n=1 Tax=Actinomortierella ambigua TaxID=1343610 RepID=A0A9P6UCY6_9FUNG|nr:hypothetical protein DFQ27_000983 [Actinomortierella ambigua]
MKFTTIVTLLGSLALTALATPSSNPSTSSSNNQSGTATGTFNYTYTDSNGQDKTAQLSNPSLNNCINIPELAAGGGENVAFFPYNRSNAAVVVYSSLDCQGTPLYIPPGEPRKNVPFYFASVKFEPSV